ncbi:hypothetical protein [Ekhidna sp.]|uniref:hypothetical protein n=1 Tax=Ekhidna sp. TaxID=2608089 RepID=UPI003297E75B
MRYLILVAIVVISCKTTSKNSQVQAQEQVIFEEVEREVTDRYVLVKLKNLTSVSQIILDPMEKSIEKEVNGEWTKVGVLYCDCGGPPCPAPANERLIEASAVFNFRWDLMIEDCKTSEQGQMTVKEKAPQGSYRATYKYKSESGEIQQMIIKFTL